ncbi:MAG: universal stress protein [Candidatus Paceibacterota bacterium]
MFKRFIVATDLSPASFAVVNCLGVLKAYGAQQCLLLQCLSVQEVASVALHYDSSALNANLMQQKEILEAHGFAVEARTVPGFAKQEINRVASDEDYELIVIGTQGHSLIYEMTLGGVAAGVIHSASKPVLLIPVQKQPGETNECEPVSRCNFTEHVLFPTDFSETADHAFEHVKGFATKGAKHITLLHVQDKSRIEPHLSHRLEQFNEIDQSRLEWMKDALSKNGSPEIDIVLSYGSPLIEILRLIRERNVHLVVMGSQGRGFVKEIFLGSVSHNVARQSHAPILLIPARER